MTQTDFVTLLSSGVLNTRKGWWMMARLWRLILSQTPDRRRMAVQQHRSVRAAGAFVACT
jgi:hypothetical protein